ncbi:adenylate kinase [Sporosarcina sp. NCCP-2716]|uniref:2-phosphoglycerate kinase n=1 Tax=Sporosarcina sp. NCCP-2716 TaxID=2943679 RepID=UPI00203BC49A|nr:2-phosphoglycerate kinase [Sporosarcina sp. NCCP-2716]GKV68660.1 adenylate kinase [Sporosarcina sp. NCCP-2716]
MIIILSAVGSTGKTVMAQRLLETYKIPYLSLDHLKMGLYRGEENCGFTPLDSTEHIGDRLWPIVKGITMTAIENRQHLIIEGCYFLPHYLHDLDPFYLNEIIPVFMGFSEKYIRENYEGDIVTFRNAIEQRITPEERTLEEMIEEHGAFKTRCVQAGVPYFEISINYETETAEIDHYINTEKQKIESRE